MNRRTFIQLGLGASLANSFAGEVRKPMRILLRSPWQTVNIGESRIGLEGCMSRGLRIRLSHFESFLYIH